MSTSTFFSIVAVGFLLSFIAVESVGVCYGRRGNNLPPPNEVVDLYKSNRIGGIRLYDTNHDILQALRGSNIPVILDVVDSDLSAIAANPSAATGWVQNNIQAFAQDVNFRYIAVGNERIPGAHPEIVLPAMKNIQNALQAAELQGRIKVSTSVSTGVFGASYPPSAGAFSSNVHDTLQPIVSFLASNGAPLLANVYPYFSYLGNPNINLNYALFTSPGTVVTDGPLQYQNLFDAMVDAFFSALEKMGGGNVKLVVSETGWPSDGGGVATQQNAQTYLSNLINHVNQGTPKKPGVNIETYIFAIFDENMKQPGGTENHYGLFNANKSPKYSLHF
ncbi:glucan endo-1,3-beta-glucosidase-like [Dendrobium catenatum]|uniref:Glucan endo-1,3-beta-glucosidase n=1 Tax=Dendrobium catenatum TaxID=906689 RepID=A0A2I0XDU2_9ASPA|nr:glucan endo-1,3-beta-glucosidase-like [Dendrobium catenatum]PKU86075.1 Glucan endo-1,3-beta-glucosidase [Dendrobium catenatum]